MTPADLVTTAAGIALLLLAASLIMTVFRVVAGPSLADRVLALDMLVAIAIGFIAVFSIRTGQSLYVDIALALALVGFLATIAFARFIATTAKGGAEAAAQWPAAPDPGPGPATRSAPQPDRPDKAPGERRKAADTARAKPRGTNGGGGKRR